VLKKPKPRTQTPFKHNRMNLITLPKLVNNTSLEDNDYWGLDQVKKGPVSLPYNYHKKLQDSSKLSIFLSVDSTKQACSELLSCPPYAFIFQLTCVLLVNYWVNLVTRAWYLEVSLLEQVELDDLNRFFPTWITLRCQLWWKKSWHSQLFRQLWLLFMQSFARTKIVSVTIKKMPAANCIYLLQ